MHFVGNPGAERGCTIEVSAVIWQKTNVSGSVYFAFHRQIGQNWLVRTTVSEAEPFM